MKDKMDKCNVHPNGEECDCKAFLVTMGCIDLEKEEEMIEKEVEKIWRLGK